MYFLLYNDLLQLIFVLVEMDNEDVGKPVADYFGITGDGPKVMISLHFSISSCGLVMRFFTCYVV